MTLREYVPGDDLRHVHWRSTARRGHLMMRQNETRRRAPVLLMLDVRPAAARPRVVRTRGRSGRVDRHRARPCRPAVRGRVEHRHDRRRAGPPAPRVHHGRARDRRTARRRPAPHRVDPPPLERAHRGHRPAARRPTPRASGCSCATAGSLVDRPAPPTRRPGRAAGPPVPIASSSPTTNVPSPTPGTRRCCDGSAPAVFLRHRHPRPPDRRGDASRSPASTRERRGSRRCCSRRRSRRRIFDAGRAPAVEPVGDRRRLALVVGAWLAIARRRPVARRSLGIPDHERDRDVGARHRATHRTSCVRRSSPSIPPARH